jgi:hypothetical protein
MNPVKAQLVSSLETLARYPWCGHGALTGTRSPFPFENVDFVLRFFASNRSGARRRLDQWMAEDFGHVGAPEEVEGNLLLATEDPMDQGDGTLDEVIQRVCSHFGLSTGDIASSRRRGALSEARAAIAFLGVSRLGLSGSRVAEQIGLSRSGVSRAIDRGAEICSNERLL